MEIRKAIKHEIKIRASENNGFIVTVGCGTFVFSNAEGMIEGLTEYLATPNAYEAEYNGTIDDAPPTGSVGGACPPLRSGSLKITKGGG